LHRSLKIIPLLVILAVLFSAVPAAARSPIAIGVSKPDGFGPDAASVIASVGVHKAEVGKKPKMWSLQSMWGDRHGSWQCQPGKGTCSFPTEAVKALHARGITPIIWWLPMKPGEGFDRRFGRYKKILKGAHDQYIKEWARAARDVGKETGKPVIIRFAQEATGHWFPWAIGRQDNTRKNYKKAWNYIGRKFANTGADPHVRWLWSHVYPRDWAYPGDRYVDYVGITLLNPGNTGTKRWKTPNEVLDRKVKLSLKITNKPIIGAEVGTGYLGGDKGKWVEALYKRAYWKHPKVKAIVYLQAARQPDWRLHIGDDGRGLKAYRKIANNPKFQGKIR